jgi:hypothetical protein
MLKRKKYSIVKMQAIENGNSLEITLILFIRAFVAYLHRLAVSATLDFPPRATHISF